MLLVGLSVKYGVFWLYENNLIIIYLLWSQQKMEFSQACSSDPINIWLTYKHEYEYKSKEKYINPKDVYGCKYIHWKQTNKASRG